ncbi:hypothetical protein LCGC14_2635760 [marine sediment metagenome]|uniref:DNA methylase N-4/N-6 domain-containing protein n=1 Tax=marine sediment metagenome TaxID=412755 RepID=A0A0F9ALH0_9ZZZZ
MPEEYKNNIVVGDARILAKRIPDESVDLIFTDPPYAKEYLDLYDWLGKIASRVLKDNGFVMTYCGNIWVHEVIRRMGLSLDFFFQYVEVNNGNSTILWPRKTIVRYKPIVCFRKKESKALPRTNVLGVWQSNGSDKRFHKWGQSEGTARYYIDCFSKSGNIVLDPFSGGGTAAAVSKKLGREFVSFEIDKDAAEIAKGRIGQAYTPSALHQQLDLV